MDTERGLGPELETAVRRLVSALTPERIYLFGSHAADGAGADSDYDLLIVVPESTIPSYRRAQAAYGLLHGVGVPIDLIILSREEFDSQLQIAASLPATVAREGRVLYAA